jgi:hypothetical protein
MYNHLESERAKVLISRAKLLQSWVRSELVRKMWLKTKECFVNIQACRRTPTHPRSPHPPKQSAGKLYKVSKTHLTTHSFTQQAAHRGRGGRVLAARRAAEVDIERQCASRTVLGHLQYIHYSVLNSTGT